MVLSIQYTILKLLTSLFYAEGKLGVLVQSNQSQLPILGRKSKLMQGLCFYLIRGNSLANGKVRLSFWNCGVFWVIFLHPLWKTAHSPLSKHKILTFGSPTHPCPPRHREPPIQESQKLDSYELPNFAVVQSIQRPAERLHY